MVLNIIKNINSVQLTDFNVLRIFLTIIIIIVIPQSHHHVYKVTTLLLNACKYLKAISFTATHKIEQRHLVITGRTTLKLSFLLLTGGGNSFLGSPVPSVYRRQKYDLIPLKTTRRPSLAWEYPDHVVSNPPHKLPM